MMFVLGPVSSSISQLKTPFVLMVSPKEKITTVQQAIDYVKNHSKA